MSPKVTLIAAIAWILFGVIALDAGYAKIAEAHAAGHAVSTGRYLFMALWLFVIALWIFLGIKSLRTLRKLKLERRVS